MRPDTCRISALLERVKQNIFQLQLALYKSRVCHSFGTQRLFQKSTFFGSQTNIKEDHQRFRRDREKRLVSVSEALDGPLLLAEGAAVVLLDPQGHAAIVE